MMLSPICYQFSSGQVSVSDDDSAASSSPLTQYERIEGIIRCKVGGCRPDRNETWTIRRSFNLDAGSCYLCCSPVKSPQVMWSLHLTSQSPAASLLREQGWCSARGSGQPASEWKPSRQTLPNSKLKHPLFSFQAVRLLLCNAPIM